LEPTIGGLKNYMDVMTDEHIVVTVAKDLEGLIPTYMTNRTREVDTLLTLLTAGDLKQICRIGLRMRGTGAPYGFDKVSVLGKQIEDDAKAGDRPALEKRIADYTDYLARVRIVYK
jgi:histidine phosphotransfer protein HptB